MRSRTAVWVGDTKYGPEAAFQPAGGQHQKHPPPATMFLDCFPCYAFPRCSGLSLQYVPMQMLKQ